VLFGLLAVVDVSSSLRKRYMSYRKPTSRLTSFASSLPLFKGEFSTSGYSKRLTELEIIRNGVGN
jgi:hypothetical protein